jgi:hypothetical protein
MTYTTLTKELLKEHATLHPLGGKILRITDGKTLMSIVGGRQGLYGDFDSTFEMAIIDKVNKKFVTKDILKTSDDICPYISFEEIVEAIGKVYKSGFQFVLS